MTTGGFMRPSRLILFCGLLGIIAMAVSMTGAAQQDAKAVGVTFNKNVLPILQKNCQTCHRPGEIAPMSFLTYKDTRPWAKAIKAAVTSRQMPPWFASEGDGPFANDKRLSAGEIATLSAWADGGAVEGDEKDRPAPVTFVDGWSITPEMIIEMPQDVPVAA